MAPENSPVVAAYKHCLANQEEVMASEMCGCFYCLCIFDPKEITEWLTERIGVTAFCPHCFIDSVISCRSGYPITPEFLAAMQAHWFKAAAKAKLGHSFQLYHYSLASVERWTQSAVQLPASSPRPHLALPGRAGRYCGAREMNELPKIWVDWNDMFGDIVALDAPWTIEHFQKQNVPIQVGVKIRLFGDDAEADAVIVEFQYNPDRPKFLGAKIVEGTLINVPFPPPDSN